VIAFDAIGSTNTEALDRARAGDRGPLWIVARRQSAGRGRRGRHWVSPPGNLHASLLLTDPSPRERAAQLSFVAALAVHDAVSGVAPAIAEAVMLKWPNDLLLAGCKFCGILIEGEDAASGGLAVAVGIGVNCAHHPRDTVFPATDLASHAAAVRPEDLFAHLADAMAQRLVQWRRGEGFADTRADWLARGPRAGLALALMLDDREVEGRFAGLDEAGRLLLRLADGRLEPVTAGDVFMRAGEPSAVRARS
jgi:BirA family biotin operon repressor/biotin-[acetyl-CoA-carboxylase] ligase